MASIDLLSRALRATRDREPYLSERLALIKVVREGSVDRGVGRAATALDTGGRGGKRPGLPSINGLAASPLRVGPAAEGGGMGGGRRRRRRRRGTRGERGAGRERRLGNEIGSPPRTAAVRERMHRIEATSPYNPKLLLARALSESRQSETRGYSAGQSSIATSHAALLRRQQKLIDKHGTDLWDRITGGNSISDAMRADQQAREVRAKRLRQRARGEIVAEAMHAELGQLLTRQLMASSASAPSPLLTRQQAEDLAGKQTGGDHGSIDSLSTRRGARTGFGGEDNETIMPTNQTANIYRSPPWARDEQQTSPELTSPPQTSPQQHHQHPQDRYPGSPIPVVYPRQQHDRSRQQQRQQRRQQRVYGTAPLSVGPSSSSSDHHLNSRRDRPGTTQPRAPALQQIHELSDRVRMLELELAQSKEAKRKAARKKKTRARRAAKRRIEKRAADKRKEFVRLAPFKSAATSAAAAVAGALAAAAAAEGLERSVCAVEDLAMESGGGIPEDLAMVLSKELDRASRRAAKTIDAASAAVSVTSAAVDASREKAGKAVEEGGSWEMKHPARS